MTSTPMAMKSSWKKAESGSISMMPLKSVWVVPAIGRTAAAAASKPKMATYAGHVPVWPVASSCAGQIRSATMSTTPVSATMISGRR